MSGVLVVGAGGLGCEVLKSLVLQGFKQITVVDPDTIEIHNLSRQLLYRIQDCGKLKAEVAAKRINEVRPDITAEFIAAPIQEVPISTIGNFGIVISTVDNIHARRWINMATMLIWRLREMDKNQPLAPVLIDGGSQEFYGHVRVLRNRDDPCLECSLALFNMEDETPSCSLPREPKTPEDCVKYVLHSNWEYNNHLLRSRDKYSGLLDRVLEQANIYAKTNRIGAVTLDTVRKTIDKPVINIGTTNSTVAAMIVHAITTNMDSGNNFYFYSGVANTVLDAFAMVKQEECMLCQCNVITLKYSAEDTLEVFLNHIGAIVGETHISVTSEKGTIYMGTSDMFRKLYYSRLAKTIRELWDVFDEVLYVVTRAGGSWYCVHLELET